jgi:hemerythrin superfamily protein
MDIYEIIKRDHNNLRELGSQIINAADTRTQNEMYSEYRSVLKSHAKSEERYFYIALLADDKSQEEARHSISEHHDIDELIEKIDNSEPGTDEWKSNFWNLYKMVTHHLDEEEKDIFQVAHEVLSERQKDDLAIRYDEMLIELKSS